MHANEEQLSLLNGCIRVDAEHWEIYEEEKLIGTFESNGSYYHFDSCSGPAVGGTGSIFGNHSVEWFLEECAEEIRQNYLWHINRKKA